jgi:ABC-type multidrug transport system fused ATPase/permease subunit
LNIAEGQLFIDNQDVTQIALEELQKRSLMFPKKVFYLVPPLKIISVMAIRC